MESLVSSDIKEDIGKLYKNEQYVKADISIYDEIEPIIKDATIVCHFGAVVDELPFNELLGPNFIGSYNVWEASKKHGVKRVIYASSIHAVGMNPRTVTFKPDTPHRPDSFYGLAKCLPRIWQKCILKKMALRLFV